MPTMPIFQQTARCPTGWNSPLIFLMRITTLGGREVSDPAWCQARLPQSRRPWRYTSAIPHATGSRLRSRSCRWGEGTRRPTETSCGFKGHAERIGSDRSHGS